MSYIHAQIAEYSAQERMYVVHFTQGPLFYVRVVSADDLNCIGQGTVRVIETFSQDMIDVLHLVLSDENTREDRILNPESIVGLTFELDD
jgi:hypothetical protein